VAMAIVLDRTTQSYARRVQATHGRVGNDA